ncbi:hypothetical protein V8G54_023395 [Vigna mungo]|uniref:Uncharacterized protein n=1 Tax=Vigna mungo TaxID=3915 RepID=A0AAQ3RP66_VIGMU
MAGSGARVGRKMVVRSEMQEVESLTVVTARDGSDCMLFVPFSSARGKNHGETITRQRPRVVFGQLANGECVTTLPQERNKTALKHNTKKANFNQEKGKEEDDKNIRNNNRMPEERKRRGAASEKNKRCRKRKSKRGRQYQKLNAAKKADVYSHIDVGDLTNMTSKKLNRLTFDFLSGMFMTVEKLALCVSKVGVILFKLVEQFSSGSFVKGRLFHLVSPGRLEGRGKASYTVMSENFVLVPRFPRLELREVEEDIRNLQQRQHLGCGRILVFCISVYGFLVIDGEKDDLVVVDGSTAATKLELGFWFACRSDYGCRWRQAATQIVVEKTAAYGGRFCGEDWTAVLLAQRRFGWCEGENARDRVGWWRENEGRITMACDFHGGGGAAACINKGLRDLDFGLVRCEGNGGATVMEVQHKGEDTLVVARDALKRATAGEDGGDDAGWCGG